MGNDLGQVVYCLRPTCPILRGQVNDEQGHWHTTGSAPSPSLSAGATPDPAEMMMQVVA